MTEKVDILLEYPPYNVRRIRSNVHVAYVLFGLKDLTKMAKALRDVMKA